MERPNPLQFLDKRRQQLRRAQRHERRVAAEYDGRALAGSGSRRLAISAGGMQRLAAGEEAETAGGDVKARYFLIEHKYTEKPALSVQRSWLLKVARGALRVRKAPALMMCFTNADDSRVREWLMLPLEEATRLLGITWEQVPEHRRWTISTGSRSIPEDRLQALCSLNWGPPLGRWVVVPTLKVQELLAVREERDQ